MPILRSSLRSPHTPEESTLFETAKLHAVNLAFAFKQPAPEAEAFFAGRRKALLAFAEYNATEAAGVWAVNRGLSDGTRDATPAWEGLSSRDRRNRLIKSQDRYLTLAQFAASIRALLEAEDILTTEPLLMTLYPAVDHRSAS